MFLIFVVVLGLAALLNIFSGHLMAVMNNVSVWWHVVGAAVIILILIFLPDNHQSFSYVFTERFNNSGYDGGSSSGITYWLLVMPFGLLLTQYTITGFDASAHLSEETQAASDGAAKGIWRSIFYSAIGGWILLLAFLFAVPNDAAGNPDNAGVGANGVAYIFTSVLDTNVAGTVLLISAVGQFFCTTACMTSASRMTFAFSRDKAIPGSSLWSKVNAGKVPANAVLLVAVVVAVITLPALVEVNIGTEEDPFIVPTAFYAVVSVAVIGLYLAFLIPIWLRWKMGDAFQPGSWTNGVEVQVDEPRRRRGDRRHLRLLHPPVRAGGQPVQRRVLVEVRQLRAGPHAGGAGRCSRSGGACRPRTGSRARKLTIDKAVIEAFDD